MANHLRDEKSPYLLQHVENPVDWYPWGEEALEKAKRESRPILLSIGYATCHWCHVMAHESFEDEAVAKILNEHFVAIKVDREERPDLDQIYMTVCQALTGRGGWPLNVFLTPDAKPFFAGTYFPRTSRAGLTGFTDVLRYVAQLWEKERERIVKASEDITQALQPKADAARHAQTLDEAVLRKGYEQLSRSFDPHWGGFGAAPKFPTPHHLTFLLRWHWRSHNSEALNMVERTLVEMRKGGIFDHVGFGFSRYSVDEKWLVPHFEKMLYDQALLAMAYVEAFQATGKEPYGQVAREIFTYVLRDMTSPEGAFFSAEDADSEGKEGWFYVWTPNEVREVLGPVDGDLYCRFFDITDAGNFEHGRSIPHIRIPATVFADNVGMTSAEFRERLEAARERLFQARRRRIPPLKDDKILTSWNGLMIAALAKAHQALQEPAYGQAAWHAADFLLRTQRTGDGRLRRRYRNGHVANPGYLDDYAFLTWGLLELYQSTFDVTLLEEALALTRKMLELFWDGVDGGFFYTAHDNEALILRDKEIYDGATPSGNSVAVLNLLRLARLIGDPALEEKGEQALRTFSGLVGDYPMAYTQFLNAVDFSLGPTQEIVIAGDADDPATQALMAVARGGFHTNRVLLLREGGDAGDRLGRLAPFAAALHPVNGRPTAFVCENFTCRQPIVDAEELSAALGG
jgi:hypothetical protein